MTATGRKRGRSIVFGMLPEVRKELEREIAKAYAAGRTIKSIERAHRVSCGFIRSVLRKQGVTLRSRGKPLGSPRSGGLPTPPAKVTLPTEESRSRQLHGNRAANQCAMSGDKRGPCIGAVGAFGLCVGFHLPKTEPVKRKPTRTMLAIARKYRVAA